MSVSAEIRIPLDPESQQVREVRPKCCTTCRIAAALVLLVLVAAGAGVYFFFVHGVTCSIDDCEEIALPNQGWNCADARCNRCSGNLTAAVDSRGGYCGLQCDVPHCTTHVVAARGAKTCSSWRQPCPRCEEGWEFELNPKTLEPTGNCSFTCTTEQRQAGCAPRTCHPKGCHACVPGFTSSDSGCSKASAATSMSFFMYRAQSDTSYPPENCDLASAAGVMWYLHNEVVKLCPRHYNISRVIRYNVTVFNPPSVYAMRQGQFGPFVAFDYGQCTVPNCPHLWEQYGYAVGCQKQDVTRWKYEDSFWYSLPGKCPSQKWSNKSSECAAQELGGNCSQPNGTQTCTWHAEQVGEVLVNDLSGISDLAAFCAAGNVEYDENTDKGRGCSFWDDKFNASRNKERVLALERHFAQRYGVSAMPEPLCDGF
mmetsp:Transcript_48163/g.105028  ORF Transcript_48163/g.105028 Transcript_48163/m.105028 type:complete len:426 (+) Transcript_48163:69-1346(+)